MMEVATSIDITYRCNHDIYILSFFLLGGTYIIEIHCWMDDMYVIQESSQALRREQNLHEGSIEALLADNERQRPTRDVAISFKAWGLSM